MIQPPLQGEAGSRSEPGGAVYGRTFHFPTPLAFGERPSPCRGG
jgi:hypothetical protein